MVLTLKDVLPYEFMGCEFEECRARKYADIEVIKKHDSRDDCWIGKHKNVTYWYELKNGYAVGFNENTARGWNFPVEKIK